jgi:P4 family phage/plasmid primase-like protien
MSRSSRTNAVHTWGNPLTASELSYLAGCGIPEDWAQAAKWTHADSLTGAEVVGRNGSSGDYSGTLIPNFWPGNEHPREYRLRLANPPPEERSDGTVKGKYRYLSPPGARNMLYFPPRTDPRWLDDVSLPIIITEGEKKCLALAVLAWHGLSDAAERPRFLPIGISGVCSWRGIVGKADGPHGERQDVKGVIPDIDRIKWAQHQQQRQVILLLDSDVHTNEQVRISRIGLAKELRRRKAHVLFADIPLQLNLKGIDDVSGQLGTEKALEIINSAYDPKKKPFSKPIREIPADYYPQEAPAPQFDQDTGNLIAPVPTIGDTLLVRERFAWNEGERLHIFAGGAYREPGLQLIRETGQRLMRQWGVEKQWNKGLADQTHEWVLLQSRRLWERPPDDRICLLNGIYNLNTHRLEPHTPDWLSPIQLPVAYDPTADCPAWDAFLAAVLPADAYAAQVTFQLTALLMIPYTGAQKALLLLGPRGTAKSRYLYALRSYIGSDNVCSKSLHALEENRFATAYLYGKLVNICADLPARHLETTSKFKEITGEDFVDAEYKGGKQFQFRPFVRLLFSANLPPQSLDTSDAFLERWWVIPFSERFQDSENQVVAAKLDRQLAEPRELSGVLNRALKALPLVLKQQGLTVTGSMKAAHDEFTAATDPFRAWLQEYIFDGLGEDAIAPCDDVLASYVRFRKNRGLPFITKTAFGRELKKQKRFIDVKQRTVRGRLQWCYIGIRLKTEKKEQD